MDQLPAVSDESPNLEAACAASLKREWAGIEDGTAKVSVAVPETVRDAIARCVNSKTKTYRYVLPTQLLAKTANSRLDCRAVQATAPMPNAFDARSICQHVVVPFDQITEYVLGGAPEPYANNPLRIPAILPGERSAQKDKNGFDDLCLVLDFAEARPELAVELLRATLEAILARLSTVRVTYPVPNRVSQSAALVAVQAYLKDRTGGIRLQAVAVALFGAMGRLYGQFPTLRSNNINAADASTGSAADLECIAANGTIVKAVEVKDRKLALLHVQAKLSGLREKGIKEAIFVVQGGTVAEEHEQVIALIQKEFSSGQNIYVAEFMAFLENHLIMFGEEGRREFLQLVGAELDARKADVAHRQRWRDLLTDI